MVTIRYVTRNQIEKAIGATSILFGGNVTANRFDQERNVFFVTLKVKDSHGLGARVSYSGRRLINACWHVYGVFFDELFAINSGAVIIARGNKRITFGEGNWVDERIGDRMFSQMCRCNEQPGMVYNLLRRPSDREQERLEGLGLGEVTAHSTAQQRELDRCYVRFCNEQERLDAIGYYDVIDYNEHIYIERLSPIEEFTRPVRTTVSTPARFKKCTSRYAIPMGIRAEGKMIELHPEVYEIPTE